MLRSSGAGARASRSRIARPKSAPPPGAVVHPAPWGVGPGLRCEARGDDACLPNARSRGGGLVCRCCGHLVQPDTSRRPVRKLKKKKRREALLQRRIRNLDDRLRHAHESFDHVSFDGDRDIGFDVDGVLRSPRLPDSAPHRSTRVRQGHAGSDLTGSEHGSASPGGRSGSGGDVGRQLSVAEAELREQVRLLREMVRSASGAGGAADAPPGGDALGAGEGPALAGGSLSSLPPPPHQQQRNHHHQQQQQQRNHHHQQQQQQPVMQQDKQQQGDGTPAAGLAARRGRLPSALASPAAPARLNISSFSPPRLSAGTPKGVAFSDGPRAAAAARPDDAPPAQARPSPESPQ